MWILPVQVFDIRQQCGSTLIEVTAAVVIMAVVSLSLIKLFTCSTFFVSTASHDIKSLNRVQEVCEEIKALHKSQKGFALDGDSNYIELEGEGSDISSEYMVALISGVGAGQVRKIAGFDPGSGKAFVEPGWVIPPAAQETTYIILRDRPYRDNLSIIAVDSGFNLQTINVSFIKHDPGESREISLTADKYWW
ncbi:MAG TPA: hypothetical protein GXX59_07495 [Syntrophomonadaceae bacterium]|nr:hypothetical protein [Syntrophomonadaceae bacterium]